MAHSQAIFLQGQTNQGKSVILRPMEESDLPHLQRWINDPENRQMLAVLFPISIQSERKWFEKVTEQDDLPADIVLTIVYNDEPVGVIGLHGINYIHRYAETGINIGEKKYRKQGIGSTAKRILMDYAFGELNLHSLTTGVYGHNIPSQKLQARCGWKEVGRWPKRFFKDGQWTDLVLYSILQDDWKKSKAEK